jgi:HK97 family phage prohead protease
MYCRFIISTPDPDRVGDRVDPEGCYLDNFRKNPVVLFSHDQQAYPIGTSRNPKTGELDVQVFSDRVEAGCWFDDSPEGRKAWEAVRRGTISAASISFRPIGEPRRNDKGGLDFDDWELLEWSLVPIPANPSAVVIQRRY